LFGAIPQRAVAWSGTPGDVRWRRERSGRSRLRDLLHRLVAASPAVPYLLLCGGFASCLVRQLRQLRRVEQELQLLLRELETARETQLATLAAPPDDPRLETAVRYVPALALGGDFYSFFAAGPRVGVILGDVSGKGTPAALVSTSICQLAGWLRPLQAPDRFLANLNQELLEHLPAETFVSMASAFLDPEGERLVIYNAGHPPCLLWSGDTPLRCCVPNLPLGMFPNVTFEPETFRFRPGDVLVLYSDAFIEARNAAGEELTVEGLEALVCRHASLPAEELADRLIEETRAFGAVTDDLTLVIVRFRSQRPTRQVGSRR
jgi:sigma-B regulation protein RsbU (phosphoserine phosphatase)